MSRESLILSTKQLHQADTITNNCSQTTLTTSVEFHHSCIYPLMC